MLEPPCDLLDPLELADWLELLALTAADENSSQGDLERVLRRASPSELADEHGDDEKVEQKTLDVFRELEQRSIAGGDAYPFDVGTPGVLQMKGDWHSYLVLPGRSIAMV